MEVPKKDKSPIKEAIEEMGRLRNNVPQFLFADGISYSSSVKLREEIIKYKETDKSRDELDFILESPGGSADDAYKIIRTLRKNFTTVNIIIPFWAKSAATLLSLGGNSIVMDEFSELGPLDVQLAKQRDDSPEIDRESALNYEYSLKRIEMRSLELFQTMFSVVYENDSIPISRTELSKQIFDYLSDFYKPLMKQINPYQLGDKKRKLEIGEKYADKILSIYHPSLEKEKKDYLVDYLINGCPDHGYVIDYDTIAGLLDGVKKSDVFGKDYERKLSELSLLLMKGQVTYVGFVEPEPEDISKNAANGQEAAQDPVAEVGQIIKEAENEEKKN